MVEKRPLKFLSLPAAGQTHVDIGPINLCDAPKIDTGKNKTSAVYGQDLNSTDLLLFGANKYLKEIISKEYGLCENFTWKFPEAFSTTSKKVIINDGENKYFIKEKPKYCCEPYNLALSEQFQRFLSERTDFVPKIINTKSGNPYLRIANTFFFVTEFAEGRMFNGSIRDVENAGEVLGKMHKLSSEFSFPYLHKKYASGDTIQFIEMADQLKGASADPWKEKTIKALKTMVSRYSGDLDKDVPYIVNHADYAPFNLVYGKDHVVAVNDFDNVDFRPRVRDLAGAIVSFCDGLSYAGTTSSLRKPIPTSLNLEKVKAFIKGYIANAPTISKEEETDLVGEICVRWAKIMSLGIIRGDFNYEDVFQALPFKMFVEKTIPGIINTD